MVAVLIRIKLPSGARGHFHGLFESTSAAVVWALDLWPLARRVSARKAAP